MADEIEIKLRASELALKAVRKLRWLQAMMQGKVQRKNLRSVYFDTAQGKLKENGLTLRVRHVGKKRLQTIKADRTGMFTRHEWECEIVGNKPDLSALPPEGRERLGTLTSLRPVFETAVTRTTIPVLCCGAELELALDSGFIRAGQRRASISEIEIELKRGDPAVLATLAERLAVEIEVSFEVRAKSERGYALAGGDLGHAVQVRDVVIDAAMPVAEVFRAIAMECLRHLSCNEGAVLGGDAGGVRQMRVGLRRLRAAISVFLGMLSDSQSQNIRSELKWLTEQLRPAWDIDVVVREGVTPLAKAATGMAILKTDKELRRDDTLARARKAVEGERYRHLILAVALWLANGAWASRADLMQRARCDRPILHFVAETLDARRDKVNKRARNLKTLTPRARHRLRTGVKTLRYAVEFFAPLYNDCKANRRRERISDSLKALQQALGHLNDFSVHQKMAELGKHSRFLAVARKASERFKVQKPFWR